MTNATNTSMQRLAVLHIVKNIKSYMGALGTLSSYGKNLVSEEVMRKLQRFEWHSISLRLFFLLLTEYTQEIDEFMGKSLQYELRPTLEIHKEQLKEFVRIVTTRAVNIIELAIPEHFQLNPNLIIEIESVNAISTLQKLQKLDIGPLPIKLKHFVQITSQCRTLTKIRAKKVSIDIDLGALNSYDKFIYQKIEVSRDQLDIILDMEMPNWLVYDAVYQIYQVYRKLTNRHFNSNQLTMLANLSLITHMNLYCELDAGQVADYRVNWPLLRSLEFYSENKHGDFGDGHFLRTLLETHGANLILLDYSNNSPQAKVPYEELFRMCPRIKTLTVGLKAPNAPSAVPEDCTFQVMMEPRSRPQSPITASMLGSIRFLEEPIKYWPEYM